MKASEIKNKSKNELDNLLLTKREDLRKFRFGVSSHKVKDVKAMNKVKKDIARILTILKEKEE